MAYKVKNRRKSKIEQIELPPDGGWGWVIVISGMVAVSNWSAVSRCFSVFYISLKNYYDTDYANLAWLNGLFQIGYGLACIVGHILISKFGFRKVTMCSGFVTGISIFVGSWLPELSQLQIFVALIPGICMGPVNVCCFTIVSRYFKRRLNLATQILCSGVTLGAFVYCPVYQAFLEAYGWRGAFQVIAGLFFNIMVVGALMRPIVLKEDFSADFLKQFGRKESFDQQPSKQDQNNNVGDTPPQCESDSCVGDQTNLDEDTGKIQARDDSESRRKSFVQFCRRIHLNVFAMPIFYAYTFSWVLYSMAFWSSLTFLVPYGSKAVGLTDIQASSLVSALMIGELISRIGYGITLDRVTKSQRFTIAACVMIFMSGIFLVMPMLKTYPTLFAGCVVLGISGGGMDGIFSVFCVDIFGLKIYSAVFGYGNIIIHSLGMLSTVMTGKIVDATGNLASAFYIGAAASICASLVTFLMRILATRTATADDRGKSPRV